MPYFIILPAYALLLLFLLGLAVVTYCIPIVRRSSGYILGGTAGSVCGFVLANILCTLLGLAPIWLNPNSSQHGAVQTIQAIYMVSVLFIGPFIASGIGVLLGFVAGMYFIYRWRRRLRRQRSAVPGDYRR